MADNWDLRALSDLQYTLEVDCTMVQKRESGAPRWSRRVKRPAKKGARRMPEMMVGHLNSKTSIWAVDRRGETHS